MKCGHALSSKRFLEIISFVRDNNIDLVIKKQKMLCVKIYIYIYEIR